MPEMTGAVGNTTSGYKDDGYGKWLFRCPSCHMQWERKVHQWRDTTTPHEACPACKTVVKAGF